MRNVALLNPDLYEHTPPEQIAEQHWALAVQACPDARQVAA
jgi:hypothetical protein